MSFQKIVLITGCSAGGIGHALAREFKSKGYRVFATARNPTTMEDLPAKGIETLVLDVTKSESIREARDKVAELTGGKLNVLVNNAGVAYPLPAIDIDLGEVRKIFDVNVFGAMEMVKEFIHLILASQDGRIINIGSIAGTIPLPFGSAYNATKAALHSYGDTLRVELAPFGVQVTTVVTGGVKTNIARHDKWQLPPDSLYAPIAEHFYARLEVAPNNGSSAEEFAHRVVKEAQKSKQKYWLWAASYSTVTWFLSTFLPRRLVDYLAGKSGKLDVLASTLKGKAKTN